MIRSKFYIKLLSAYLVIIFLYTFIASGLLFYKNREIVNLELNRQKQFFVEQNAERMDTILLVGMNLITQLRVDPEILIYAGNEEENNYNVLKVQKELVQRLDAFSNFGYSVGIARPGGDSVVTPETVATKKRFYEEIKLPEQIISKLSGNVPREPHTFYTVSDSISDSDPFLHMVRREKLSNDKELLFFVTIYKQYIMPSLQAPELELFAILDRNKVIARNSDTGFKTVLISDDMKRDGDYLTYQASSKVLPNWKYVYAAEQNPHLFQISSLIKDTLVVSLLLGILGLVLALLFTRKLYRPIVKLVSLFKSYSEEFDEKDEMALIENAATRISTMNENLKDMLQTSKIPLRAHFLRELLYGLVPVSKIQEQLDKYNMEALKEHPSVILIEFINYKEMEDQYSKELIFKIKKQIILILEEELKSCNGTEVVDLEFKSLVVLVNTSDLGEVKQIVENLLVQLEEHDQFHMVAAVGKSVERLEYIEHSFQEAQKLMDYRFSVQKRVISANDLDQDIQTYYYYPIEVENYLVNYIVRGKAQEANALLTKVLTQNLEQTALSGEGLSHFILAIIGTINRTMQLLNMKVEQVTPAGTDLYTDLKQSESRSQLQSKILYMFETMMQKSDISTINSDNETIERMLEYIQDHYSRDISLNDIAEVLNLSPGYVSTIFKSAVGENFKDYLNILRVKKAKEILSKQNVKIQDLAVMVGCNNVNTFIRIFKKVEGISPGAYLKSNAVEYNNDI